ncbi:MAG: DUF1330 domain-containing protein [Myxococcales bacterium]|nr:DUF1330 domain-containing protein [Myxococcales bacterium]
MGSFENQVLPKDPEQIAALKEPGPDGPIFMVNLLKFKERAKYKDGRKTDLSGREAYQLYAEAVMRILESVGGQLVFAGDVTHLALGRVDELWDEIAIARYPKRSNLLELMGLEAWQEAAVHREAGLEGQLLIETTMVPGLARDLS